MAATAPRKRMALSPSNAAVSACFPTEAKNPWKSSAGPRCSTIIPRRVTRRATQGSAAPSVEIVTGRSVSAVSSEDSMRRT
ncbi:MAG: hypothetical protein ACYTAF_04340, partial [Planctomycetota bacterium]